MLKLYEIADDIRALLAVLEDPEPDPNRPDSLQEAVRDTLAALNLDTQFEQKALSVSCFIKELEAELNAVQDTLNGFKSRSKHLEHRIGWLKDYLLVNMQKVGKTELQDHQIRVKLRKTPAKVVIDNEAVIPDAFKETETLVHIRKSWMLDQLRSGQVDVIPGIHLETGFALSIR